MKFYASNIARQMINDTGFAWFLWDKSRTLTDRTLANEHSAKIKLELLLDSLSIEAKAGTSISRLVQEGTIGAIFVTACLAIEHSQTDDISQLLSTCAEFDSEHDKFQAFYELLSALEWLEFEQIAPYLGRLYHSDCSWIQSLTLFFRLRHDKYYNNTDIFQVFNSGCDLSKSIILRIVGEKHLTEYLPLVDAVLTPNKNIHLATQIKEIPENTAYLLWEASRCAVLFHKSEYFSVLQQLSLVPNYWQRDALLYLYSWLPADSAKNYLLQHIQKSGVENLAVLSSIAILGMPDFVNHLFKAMENPMYAPFAWSALACITDCPTDGDFELEVEPLELEFDENEAVDLLWGYESGLSPNVPKLRKWWQNTKNRFTFGRRYTLAYRLDDENLKRNLQAEGNYVQRSIVRLQGLSQHRERQKAKRAAANNSSVTESL